MRSQLLSVVISLGVLLLVGCGAKSAPTGTVVNQSTSAAALAGRDLLLQIPFEAGVSHVSGRYGFTEGNFLLEGAERIQALGAHAIFVYLTPNFRNDYPDKTAGLWPRADPASLVELARSAPFQSLFQMPFRTYVVTIFTFGNNDNIAAFATDTQAAAREEAEVYDLARYLLTTYAGTGKVFILKHWEGDFEALQGFDTSQSISPTMASAMITWLSARQRGVSRARQDTGNPAGVGVFHAVEVNRIFDYSQHGLDRVVNAVLPYVGADMVTYSSYDASLAGSDGGTNATDLEEAFEVIYRFAPDPLNLGARRLVISEYGLFETERPGETEWRGQSILQTAKSAGLAGAFLWEVFDNECKDASGNYFPIDASPGDIKRPTNSQCRGLWLIKPDGTQSSLVSVLQPFWER
jgi:hypothetical protein